MISMRFFWPVVWAGVGILLVVAWLSVRARLRRALAAESVKVDDDAVAQILEDGVLSTSEDEPLDLEHIQKEEESFWEETWDEPEEV